MVSTNLKEVMKTMWPFSRKSKEEKEEDKKWEKEEKTQNACERVGISGPRDLDPKMIGKKNP